ncbi:MAG TPA: A/G-specific adenine glycosylase [Candidatus Saccharimonadia bacterium]|nr:A/G-specific adenine glycosylase [Candidatus Saccharimonadia bacterium]
MLQQTQVQRVRERFPLWLRRFPDFDALASASVTDVLLVWSGMGYNRRALWLREASRMVTNEFKGRLPRHPMELVRLPGVGPNTAGSIAAFAYDEPTVFIETNIRRLFIHEFFPRTREVHDRDILRLVEESLDRERPREWYYALMDAGSELVKRVPNPNRRSRHYSVQQRFEGSVRQLRGQILRQLGDGDKTMHEMGLDDPRAIGVLETLVREGFLSKTGESFGILK